MKILLITPPLLQPNTPYPATPILTAWLRSQGHDAVQADLSIELLLQFFSREGLSRLFQALEAIAKEQAAAEAEWFLDQKEEYLEAIEPVMAFLQGKGALPDVVLPEGPHLARAFEQEEELQWNFRGIDPEDLDRHLASLYLDDVAEAYRLADPNFAFSRYAENDFSEIPTLEEMKREGALFFQALEKLTDETVKKHQPELVVLTVPFPDVSPAHSPSRGA